jgi:carboxylesterase
MINIIPDSEPFLFNGGQTGCILLHGFSTSPEEMRPLGEFLAKHGFSVLGTRLAGHGTKPEDLKTTHWTDWLDDVEDGLAYLSNICSRRVLIGQSMGGMIALIAAARYPVSGVVALSTPYGSSRKERWSDRLLMLLRPTIYSQARHFPPGHPLHHRREVDYPAYPEYPTRILIELDKMAKAMPAALSQVQVPVLLVHSKADTSIPFSSMQLIHDQLASHHKEMLAIEGMDHSLVMDPNRQVVFEAILNFLNKLS